MCSIFSARFILLENIMFCKVYEALSDFAAVSKLVVKEMTLNLSMSNLHLGN